MAYKMTPKRKAALRKAQLVSARKRRGKGKGKPAKANRSTSRARKTAVVAATGGLVFAAAGIAGAYYARKTSGGGPKAPKLSYGMNRVGRVTRISSPKSSIDPGFSRRMGKPFTGDPGFSRRMGKPFTGDPGFLRKPGQLGRSRRTGPPRSNSLKAVGYAFDTQNRWSIKPPKPTKARVMTPARRAEIKNAQISSALITGLARHRMADKANRKRGLDGYIPSKAKFDRRRTKAQRKKYPRS